MPLVLDAKWKSSARVDTVASFVVWVFFYVSVAFCLCVFFLFLPKVTVPGAICEHNILGDSLRDLESVKYFSFF